MDYRVYDRRGSVVRAGLTWEVAWWLAGHLARTTGHVHTVATFSGPTLFVANPMGSLF